MDLVLGLFDSYGKRLDGRDFRLKKSSSFGSVEPYRRYSPSLRFDQTQRSATMTEFLILAAVVYMTFRLCAGAMVLPEAIMTNDLGKFIKAVIGW